MEQFDVEQFDATVTAGRKGVAYDWQTVLAASEAARLDAALLELAAAQPAA